MNVHNIPSTHETASKKSRLDNMRCLSLGFTLLFKHDYHSNDESKADVTIM